MMRYLFLLLPFFFVSNVRADSPLTSTPFADAYASEKMVMYVATKGLDEKAMKYLGSEDGDAVVKIAMINQLSWGNMEYTKAFEKYLIEKRKVKEKVFKYLRYPKGDEVKENKWTKKLTADDLMCWAYFNALGNYFNPQMSSSAAQLAMQREQNSMAHASVYALISCQVAFDKSWCNIYKLGQLYFVEKTYESNPLNADAVQVILDYLNLYKADC
ncbi:MAG: hypothetical protein GQ574_25165 [Crocinitomix sp.]|nr:hypothetical protein [Crocinitomix sp.]